MKIFVEFDSGARTVPDVPWGLTAAVEGGSPITIIFITFDTSRNLWLYAESLNGPWHWADEKTLHKIDW